MPVSDLGAVLRERVAVLMRRLPAAQARQLAALLTGRINAALAGGAPAAPEPAFAAEREAELAAALPPQMMNVATLAIPWQAFALAHQDEPASAGPPASALQLLCSLPAVLEPAMRATLAATGIWPGGILDCMAAILSDARGEIAIISPYWSEHGVDAIFRRMQEPRLASVRCVILTPPQSHHKPESLRGLRHFERRMTATGARCEIYSCKVTAGWTPLLHAKAIVADCTRAYVGSANPTGNGLDASVELGVSFQGAKAAQLGAWIMALARQLQAW